MKFSFQNNTNLTVEKSLFTEILKHFSEDNTVELLLTNNKEIQTLNKRFRHIDKPTDVLSFPLNDPNLLGQIVISVDKAKTQAKELNQSLEEELKFLFTHGILHLHGYDHKTPKEEEIMLKETYKILNRKQ